MEVGFGVNDGKLFCGVDAKRHFRHRHIECPRMDFPLKAKADAVLEFLELSIHGILHARKIYPPSVFALKQKYRMPVRVAIHPKINEYIVDCLKTVKLLMSWNSFHRLTVVVTLDNKAVERHVFQQLLTGDGVEDEYHIELEQKFREYLYKISMMETKLPKLPENSNFSIVIGTSAKSSVRLNDSLAQEHFPWIEVSEDGHLEEFSIIHMTTVKTKHLSLDMFIEKN